MFLKNEKARQRRAELMIDEVMPVVASPAIERQAAMRSTAEFVSR